MKTAGIFIFKTFVTFFIWALIPHAFSAPCCGGGQGQTAIITGDEKSTFLFHYLYSAVAIDALEDGTYLSRGSDLQEFQHTYIVEGSHHVHDRWQIGGRLPLIYRYVAYENDPESIGFGDAQLFTAWEALPALRFSRWKPKVFLFSQLSFPLGNSPFNNTRPASSMSRGFWLMSIGAMATKQWQNTDVSLTTEIHNGFSRRVQTDLALGTTVVSPGTGTSLSVSSGWQFAKKWYAGLSESFFYESGSSYAEQYFWATSLRLKYSPNDVWAISAAYTDQTLLGAARNVALNRIFAATIARSWER